ncbi:MAG: hypothetical protein E7390_08145 [Ruminococcaceae bacterium]|nr:hypothetical protein [Oscillospiraceae bacterium]
MFVCLNKYQLLVQTPFSEAYDLVQKFRGLDITRSSFNDPVDFMEAGLIRKDKWDCFHLDIPFHLSNDEVPSSQINGNWNGAGHGDPCCIALHAPRHDKTVADIGSVWVDAAGVSFTLLRIATEDHLIFVSENIGTLAEYKFVMQITDRLTYLSDGANTLPIPASGEQKTVYLTRAYKFTKKRVVVTKDGKDRILFGSAHCDSARIEEEYLHRNPATVAPALTAARPPGGFASEPDLGDFGETMLIHRLCYHMSADGTVLCEFQYEKKMPVHIGLLLGVMYQERLDVYGGGIYRHIPKTLPVVCEEGTFDFSGLVPMAPGPFPKCTFLGRDFWSVPAAPPDRNVDYFKDTEGNMQLAFACGFLPIYDGVPEKRLQHLENAALLYHSRKMYPLFMDGDVPDCHGIAYRKYFIPERDSGGTYTIRADGKTFIFADFFSEKTFRIPISGPVQLFEKSDSVSYAVKDNILTVSGRHGYAVFYKEEL